MVEVEFLQNVHLFKNLEKADLNNIAGIMRERRYRKNQVLFHEGDPGDALYIVKEGTIKIYQYTESGYEKTLALFQSGDGFGEMALLEDGQGRSATAEALEPSVVYVIFKSDFQALLFDSKALSITMIHLLAERLRTLNKHLSDSLFLNVRSRVAKLLKQLALHSEDGKQIRVPLTHKELAKIAGTSRETVTKVLLELQDEKLITFDKKTIVVLNSEKLYSQ